MKKRFLSLVLLFVFAVGLGVPAAAYEEEDSFQGLAIATEEDLRLVGDLETVELRDCGVPLDPDWDFELEAEVEEIPQDEAEDISRATRVPDLYLKSMYISPMVYVSGNGQPMLVVLDPLKWSVNYGANAGYPQFGVMRLTSAEFRDIFNITSNYVSQLPQFSGMRVLFAGWRVGGIYQYAAQKPLYFEYEGDGEGKCVSPDNPKKESVSGTSGLYDVHREFLVPDENYEGYYSEVVRGGFYFISNGQQLGAGLGVTLVVNSDK